jgi:Tol biopolymer transport system component
MEVARPVPVQVTFDPSEDGRPLWSPDGTRLVFWSNRRPPPAATAGQGFYYKSSSGAGPDQLLRAGVGPFGVPLGFSSDGQSLLYSAGDERNRIDLWTLPLVGDQKPAVVLQTPQDEGQAQISPDGRWIAYVSNETSRNNVYVKAFPSGDNRWPVSTNGGVEPRWGKDGREIFYLAPDRCLMAVDMKTGPAVEAGRPTCLFPTRMSPLAGHGLTINQYVFAAGGQRFLINQPRDERGAPIMVALNWTALLKR